MNINHDMDKAIINLVTANERHAASVSRACAARQDEAKTLNEVNQAQKILGELVQCIKNQAPCHSDWYQARIRALSVT